MTILAILWPRLARDGPEWQKVMYAFLCPMFYAWVAVTLREGVHALDRQLSDMSRAYRMPPLTLYDVTITPPSASGAKAGPTTSTQEAERQLPPRLCRCDL